MTDETAAPHWAWSYGEERDVTEWWQTHMDPERELEEQVTAYYDHEWTTAYYPRHVGHGECSWGKFDMRRALLSGVEVRGESGARWYDAARLIEIMGRDDALKIDGEWRECDD